MCRCGYVREREDVQEQERGAGRVPTGVALSAGRKDRGRSQRRPLTEEADQLYQAGTAKGLKWQGPS